MTRRRTPRTTRTVLGGVGAGAVLAVTAPLTPVDASPPGPVGVDETLPLRVVGVPPAAGALLPAGTTPAAGPAPPSRVTLAAPGSTTAPPPVPGPPPVLDIADATRAVLAAVPADPGSAARAALDAVAARAALDAAAVRRAAEQTDRAAPAPERTSAPGPGPAPAGERATTPATGLSGAAARVVELTNAERTQAGCSALTVDPRITAAAQAHSEDMAARGYFAHDSQDGRDFADRITAAGYDAPGAENIAMGQQDAADVVQDWMESPGHRANILNCSLTTIGVGLADGYWTQNFGR